MKLIKSIKSQWNGLSFKYKIGWVIASATIAIVIIIPFLNFLGTERILVERIGDDLLTIGQCELRSQNISYLMAKEQKEKVLNCNKNNGSIPSSDQSKELIKSIEKMSKVFDTFDFNNKGQDQLRQGLDTDNLNLLVVWLQKIQENDRQKNKSIDVLVDDVYLFYLPSDETNLTWRYIASSGFIPSQKGWCEEAEKAQVCLGDSYEASNLIKSRRSFIRFWRSQNDFRTQAGYGRYLYGGQSQKNDYFITSTIPIFKNEGDTKPIAILAIDFQADDLKRELKELRNQFMIFGLVAAGGLIAISILISNYFTRPIAQLEEASNKLSEDLSVRVKIDSQDKLDELGRLSQAFNRMADQLQESLDKEIEYAKNREIQKIKDQDLEKGRNIQKTFLPDEDQIPHDPGWDIQYVLMPALELSGDFYDVFPLKNDNVCLVIADVCDKGIGAAMFMGLCHSLLRIYARQNLQEIDPARLKVEVEGANPEALDLAVLNTLKAVVLTNDYVAEEGSDIVMFATLFFGVLNPQTGMLTYISGGHEPVFIVNANGIKHTLEGTKPAMGVFPNAKFTVKQVKLETGDLLVGYTDGVTDARNADGEKFGKERLRSLLSENPTTSALELKKLITNKVTAFMGEQDPFDDITLLICGKTL